MKKDGFNPRMNSESTRSLFKLNLDDIEEKNKQLENKLKSKKTKLNIIDLKHSSKNSYKEKKQNLTLSNMESSFLSNKQSISPSKTTSKTQTPTKTKSFKNKLNSQCNLEITTSKTTKSLIPFNEEETKMKELVSKMKLCQKHNLPNEKNYFVTEKNLKLIEQALLEKDSDINNLKSLLSYAKNDFENFKLKYKELNKVIEEQAEEKITILKAYDDLAKSNKQLQENYDDYSYQYNKMLIYFKKFETLIHLVIKLKDSYLDSLKADNVVTKIETFDSRKNSETNTVIYIPKTKKETDFIKRSRNVELFNQITKIFEDEEIKAYLGLFINTEVKNSIDNKTFLTSPAVNDYLKIENQNKLLKDKLYDYESFVEKLSFLYESKKIELSDMAKDMISTKKRISELNIQNDSLEKENDYLRISYHNLYVSFFYLE